MDCRASPALGPLLSPLQGLACLFSTSLQGFRAMHFTPGYSLSPFQGGAASLHTAKQLLNSQFCRAFPSLSELTVCGEGPAHFALRPSADGARPQNEPLPGDSRGSQLFDVTPFWMGRCGRLWGLGRSIRVPCRSALQRIKLRFSRRGRILAEVSKCFRALLSGPIVIPQPQTVPCPIRS
jgi:hypothetical protein